MKAKFVRPLVTQVEAEKHLALKRHFFPRASKQLKKVELIYLPYFWAKLETEFKGKRETLTVAVDGIEGVAAFPKTDFVRFEEGGKTGRIPFFLREREAESAAFTAARHFSLQVGIRQKLPLKLVRFLSLERMYYPFWVGYYGSRKGFSFKALDAVSGAIQGAKMKQVFAEAIKILQQLQSL